MSKVVKKEKSERSNLAFKNSIQFKLISISVGLFFIGLVFILFAVAFQIDHQAYLDFQRNSENQLEIVENYITNFYSNLDKNINMIATNPTVMQADDTITSYKYSNTEVNMTPSRNGGIEQEIYNVFNQYAQAHPETLYLYAATGAGGYVAWPEATINKLYDPTQRDWYQEALQANGKIIRTAPYVNSATDSMITSNARALYNNQGKLVGVVGIGLMSI